MKPVALTLLALALTGCSMAPTYERPAAPVPAAYTPPSPARPRCRRTGRTISTTRRYGPGSPPRWPTTATCAWRPCASRKRALYGVQRADRLPSVDGTAGYSRSRASDPGPSRDAISQQYRAGVGITAFELDFFGRIKSLTDAALERYLASAEAHRAAALSLVAETATAYFNERSLAEQQRLTRSTLELRETTLTPQRRYDAGLETAMGLRTAQMLVESSRATLAELSREHSQAVHALGLLAGDFCRPTPTRRRWKARALPAGGRPAVGAADAASGSAPGGEHAQGGQRRYRRGARGLSRRCS